MNLNTATNEQLEAYREQIAKVQGIDPLMLDYIWMDDAETGLRNRVLYAKRGVAEILRQKLSIDVTSLVMHESNGWVMFTATGKDKTGRQEMAVGAAYLDGLKADKKAHGVMTAQTRAVRRLTLQFVTGGVLDETEVQAQANLPATASAAQLAGSPTVIPPMPTVTPSAAPGQDITPPKTDTSPEAMEKFSAQQQTLRDDATRQLLSPKEPVSPSGEIPAPAETPAPKKRTRRSRNTVSLQTEMPVGHIDSHGTITVPVITNATISVPPATAKEPEQGANGNGKLKAPALAEHVKVEYHVPLPPHVGETVVGIAVAPAQAPTLGTPAVPAIGVAPAPTTPVLSPEKSKEYRERLSKYSSTILAGAGMMPVDGVGGVTMQLRLFSARHVGVPDSTKLTEAQFEDLLGFLDDYVKSNGAQALVKYIQKSIGVK